MADDEEEVFDLYGLRKRLNDEYTFINQQKREIQDEYSKIVSTGDSLFRSFWVNGQQWKNFLRLKGGSKFASECVYAASLLDSISFVDGYMRIGFKEVKYGNFLKALKDDTAMVKSILIVVDELMFETSALVRTILISLYSSCLFPEDEMAVLQIMRSIIEYHLVFSKAPLAIFHHDRNSFACILEEILQTSYPARSFLVSACKETIFNILLDGSMFWPVEEQELLSVMDVSKVRQKFGDPGSPGTADRIRTYMDQSWAKLTDTVYMLVKKIDESLACLPDNLLLIVSYFHTFSKKRGFTDHQARIIVLRLLFNQLITPALLKPQPLLLDIEVRASTIALFNLRKIVDILKMVVAIEAGEMPASMSDEAQTFYANLDRAPFYEVVDNLLKKVPVQDYSLMVPKDIPGIARTSALITNKELDSLIMLLTKLHQFAALPETDNPHPVQRLVNENQLRVILHHLNGIDKNVTASLEKLSLSTQSVDEMNNDIQDILQTFNVPVVENEEVLVISLGMNIVDCPGMLQEEKVLGMPTPKVKRKPVPTARNITLPDQSFDVSQISDSDSNESSSDEKPLDMKAEHDEAIEKGEDVVLGFENSFIDFPSDAFPPTEQTTGTAEIVDPFKIFDSAASTSPPGDVQNDPFVSVVSLPWQAAETPPYENKTEVLVDFTDTSDTLGIPPLPHASRTLTSKPVTGNSFRNSSSSQSSTDRHSSTASSGSDGTFVQAHLRIRPNGDNVVRTKEKKSVSRKKSLKTIHDVITSARKEKKKKSRKSRGKPKDTDAILDANDVATIIAASVDQEKTAKDICDEIISKYVKRVRSVSSEKDLEVKKSSSTGSSSSASYDEEEMVKDAKNKLRYVLSCGSKPVLPFAFTNESTALITKRDHTHFLLFNYYNQALDENSKPTENKRKWVCEDSSSTLLCYLKKDLADAVANQNTTMIARLHETLSATANLPPETHHRLLRELDEDYRQRKLYISYLIRSRQGLTCTRIFLENMLKRVERDREICRRFLTTECVRMYMEKIKDTLELFTRKFQRLSMSDEKSEAMKTFLEHLKESIENDSMWLGSNEKQRAEIMDAVERSVIGRVYLYALYAFGETDKFRDDVFHDNVELMCKSIGDNFVALDIKEEYQHEAPWYPAQHELYTLAAYKTPVDKLKCIQRCCTTIMTLLGMSSGSGAVGADAFTPVLIYVVMHANPRGLLTTVDFINSYLREPLTGEQYYCWMQFCSAIQFIKILMEENKSKNT